MASFFKKLSKAVPALTQGIGAGMKMRSDAERMKEDQLKRLAEEYTSGLARTPEGSIAANPDFTNPESDLYKWAQRNAGLKHAGTSSKNANALTADQLKGLQEGTLAGDVLVPSGYANFMPRAKGADGMTFGEIKSLQDGTLDPNTMVPKSAFGLTKPREPKRVRSTWGQVYQQAGVPLPAGQDPSSEYPEGLASPVALKPKDQTLSPLDQERLQEIKDKRAEAKRKEEEKKAKVELGRAAKQQEMETVLQDANRALSILGKQSPGVRGAIRQKLGSIIPGTQAADLENLLTTVKAVSGFEKLQAMRDASPTGGALGQVSDFENRQLQSMIGNLDASSSPQQRAENLKRVINKYLDIIHGPGGGPPRYPLSFDESGQKIKKPSISDGRADYAKKIAPGDRAASARKFPIITPKMLDTIAAPDPKVAAYAKQYQMEYDAAEKLLRSRGYGKKQK